MSIAFALIAAVCNAQSSYPELMTWLGSYQTDAAVCTPSASCCCTVGTLTLSPWVFEQLVGSSVPGAPAAADPVPSGAVTMPDGSHVDPTRFVLSGALDGGSACLNSDAVQGAFAISPSNALQATLSVQGFSFTATLTSDANAAGGWQLQFVNSIYSCPSVAAKVAAFAGQAANVTVGSSSTGSGGSQGTAPQNTAVSLPHRLSSKAMRAVAEPDGRLL